MSSTYFELSFRSVDPDETEHHLSETYGRSEITREFRALTNRAAGDERFQIADGGYEGSCVYTVDLDRFVFATATPSMPWREGRAGGDMAGEPAAFRPGSPYSVVCTDTEVRVAAFDPVALQRTARLLYGRDDLVVAFDGPRPSAPAAARTWLAAFAMARRFQQEGPSRTT